MAVLQATSITGGLTMHGMAAGFMKLSSEGAVMMDTNTYATTSQLSSYLSLSGGTLTGPVILNDAAYFRGTPTYGFRFNNNADTLNNMTLTNASGNLFVRGQIYIGGNGFDSGTQVVYNSGTWAINITGNASSSTTTTHLSGRTDGSWYNVIWGAGSPSYLYSADSVQIRSSDGALRANIYYDNQNTNFYLDPNGTSNLNQLVVSGDGSDRARLYVRSSANAPNDLWFGAAGINHWSLTSRDTSNPFFGLYNAGIGDWAYTVNYSSNVINFVYGATVGGSTVVTNNGGTWGINISGNSATTSQRSFSGDISTGGMGRFTGWYNGTAATGLATEVGISSGEGYVIVYNRNSGSYGSLNLNAVNIKIDPQGGSVTVSGSQIVTNNGGTWGINITGTAAVASIATDLNAADGTQINFNNVTNTDYSTMTFMSRAWQSVQGANGLAYNFTTHTNGGAGGYGALQIYYGESGYVFAPTSFRAPIFYDSNDTGYYLDPNSTSDAALRIRGGTLHGPNPTWGKYLYVGTNGRPGGDASVAVTNGNLHIDCENGYALYLNWYSNNNIYTQGNMAVGSDVASHRLHVHGTGLATSDFRAPIFYDSANTSYYCDPASTSVLNTISSYTIYNTSLGSGYYFTAGSWGWRHQTPSGYIEFGPANSGHAHIYTDRSNFYFNVDVLYMNGNRVYGDNYRPYADSAGNADTVDGYHAAAFPYRSGGSSGYYQVADWMQFNTSAGLYWPSYYNAHIEANTQSSYGSINIRGSKNGWAGINFSDSNNNLMANSNESGFHRGGYGWQFRWENGTLYCHKNSYGGGTSATVLDSSNYTSYAPSTGGSGASGTWSINITGDANTVDGVDSSQIVYGGSGRASNYDGSMNDTNQKSGFFFKDNPTGQPFGDWWNWMTVAGNSWQSSNNYSFQLAHAFHSDDFYVRRMTNGTAYSWRYLLTNANYNSYAPTLTGSGASGTWGISISGNAARATRANGNFYIDDNYGNTIVGVYASTRYQGVFAMGDAYKLPADGTGPGNLYGLAWSHPNAGGVAGNLNTHGLLVLENGTFLAAISGSIRARDDMRAPIFYDSNDTGYYVDPNSTSNLYKFSADTMARNDMNTLSVNSPWSTRAGQSSHYRNGTMGWGNNDFNTIGSYWGSGFIDTWSNPGNAPGGSSHYVGMQGMHYNDQNGNFHGWQMACAQESTNRWFWRSSWNIPNRPWVEMIHSGNIGSQSVSYASSAGHASTASNITDFFINQSLGTGSGPTFAQVYASGWFRNYGNQGIYNQDYGVHFYAQGSTAWSITGSGGNVELQFRSNHNSTVRGYVYANTSNEIGFLRNDGNWALRCDPSSNVFGHNNLYAYYDVIAYYSDERLKTKTGKIDNALTKIMSLEGFSYVHNDLAVSVGYTDNKKQQIGLSAQEVQKIAPELVTLAAFDVAFDENGNEYSKSGENYLTIKYDRLVPILVEAIKEQQKQIEELKAKLN